MTELSRRSLLALGGLSVAALAFPASASAATVQTIKVFGDSMSLGWPTMLGDLLAPYGVKVIGKGNGGQLIQDTEITFNANLSPNTGYLVWGGHTNMNHRSGNSPADVVPALLRMQAKVPLGMFCPWTLSNDDSYGTRGTAFGTTFYKESIAGPGSVNAQIMSKLANPYDIHRYLVVNGRYIVETVHGQPWTTIDQHNVTIDDCPPDSMRADKCPPGVAPPGPDPNDPCGNPGHIDKAYKSDIANIAFDLVRRLGWVL